MATKKRTKAVENTPQFNYRHVGEPETYGTESKEDPGGQRDFPAKGSAPTTKTEAGLSEMAGMSEPKDQESIDLENAWTTSRK